LVCVCLIKKTRKKKKWQGKVEEITKKDCERLMSRRSNRSQLSAKWVKWGGTQELKQTSLVSLYEPKKGIDGEDRGRKERNPEGANKGKDA